MSIILHGLILGIYFVVIVGVLTKFFNIWYKFINNKIFKKHKR